jgi:hypothetical protein
LLVTGVVMPLSRRRVREQAQQRAMAEAEFTAILSERNRVAPVSLNVSGVGGEEPEPSTGSSGLYAATPKRREFIKDGAIGKIPEAAPG